jgi:hypothetical protein
MGKGMRKEKEKKKTFFLILFCPLSPHPTSFITPGTSVEAFTVVGFEKINLRLPPQLYAPSSRWPSAPHLWYPPPPPAQ